MGLTIRPPRTAVAGAARRIITGKTGTRAAFCAWVRSMHAAHRLEFRRAGDPWLAPVPPRDRPAAKRLTEVLLRGPGTLARGERELIAAYVSALNDCRYCSSSHAACAAAQMPAGMALVEQVRADPASAPVSAKLKALLTIASAVAQNGHAVTAEHIAGARAPGATDVEIQTQS